MTSELTEDQKRFLAECEAEFSNRYTDQDKDFLQVCIKYHVYPAASNFQHILIFVL